MLYNLPIPVGITGISKLEASQVYHATTLRVVSKWRVTKILLETYGKLPLDRVSCSSRTEPLGSEHIMPKAVNVQGLGYYNYYCPDPNCVVMGCLDPLSRAHEDE